MKVTFGQGLTDALGSEAADGFVTDCEGFRFRGGFAEVIGGKTATGVTFSGTGGRSLSQLYTATDTYIVGSTSTACGVYTVGGSTTPDDITRETEGVAITNATAAGTTVTITTTSAHGRSTGNTLSTFGFTPSTYNVESASITVTGPTTFTYVVPSAPAVSPATAMGMYSRDGILSNAFVSPGGELNGVLILNSTTSGCYYWGGDTSIPIRKVVGSYTARAAVPFGNFIVQLAPTIDSVEYPFRICWSNATEPGTVPHNGFIAATGNQAGDVEKPEIGELVWALPLGDDLIVYGTKGRLVMRYIGGNDVFQFTKLPGEEGLFAIGMVTDTPVGHVFVDRDRHVRVHSGGATKDISIGRVQSYLGASDISVYWVINHARQGEVWIGYDVTNLGSGPTGATYALIWNWSDDTWGRAAVVGVRGISVRTADVSTNLALYFVTGTSSIAMSEYDVQSSAASTATLTRQGMDAGSSDVMKNLQRSRWAIASDSGVTPVYTIEHGSSKFADTDPTYATGVPYVVGTTDWANARATGGRFMAVRLTVATTTSYSESPYYGIRVRSADLDFTTGGKR